MNEKGVKLDEQYRLRLPTGESLGDVLDCN